MEENKKSASPKKNCAYGLHDSIVCIKGGISLPVDSRHNRPSPRLTALAAAISKLRFGYAFACMEWSCPQYAISDGRFAPRLPLQEVKSRSHRSLEHNLRNGARRMPASKVKHCKLRGQGASRGRRYGAPGGGSHDSTRGSTPRR